MYFSNVNVNVSINDYSLKTLCSTLFKTLFLLPYLFCNVEFELIQLIPQHQTVVRDFKFSNRNAA